MLQLARDLRSFPRGPPNPMNANSTRTRCDERSIRFQKSNRGRVRPAEPDAEVIALVAERRAGQEQDAFVFDEPRGERVDRLVAEEPRKPDRAAAWSGPGEAIAMRRSWTFG